MNYPSIPLATNTPAWLVSIDPLYMGGIFPSVGANPFSAIVGGLAALPGPTSGGFIITTNQGVAMTNAWISNPQTLGCSFVPQRFGMRYNWIVLNGNTYGAPNT